VPHQYLEIARDLRRRIESGEFAPGSRLPGMVALGREHGVGTDVVREAFGLLELDGLVVTRPGRAGTVVLDPAGTRRRVDVGRQVVRNEFGYVFHKSAGHWPPVAAPTRGWMPAPAEVADHLGITEGDEVLVRHRATGPNGKAAQITRTFIPADLARGTVLEEADTGPGGVLDRLENDFGHGPLKWHSEISARLPTDDEAAQLGVSRRLPVLITLRVATSPKGRVVAVDEVVVDARRNAVCVPITRGSSAKWPTTPATARNGLQNARGGDTPQEALDQPPNDRQAP
jgi:GntR family transcriptional regulator